MNLDYSYTLEILLVLTLYSWCFLHRSITDVIRCHGCMITDCFLLDICQTDGDFYLLRLEAKRIFSYLFGVRKSTSFLFRPSLVEWWFMRRQAWFFTSPTRRWSPVQGKMNLDYSYTLETLVWFLVWSNRSNSMPLVYNQRLLFVTYLPKLMEISTNLD